MTAFFARSAAIFSVAVIPLIGTGCATKKHVRQVVGPVEARVSQAERKNVEQQAALGELENSVSRADERAMDADRKAREAGEAAKVAHGRADTAFNRADTAFNRAESVGQLAESTRNRLGQVTENIDNYKLVKSENVLFGLNRYQLTKDMKQQLDTAVAQLQNSKNYVLEIQGFTDKTGSAAHNLELSRKRADSVVRYLTVEHNIPLRKINVLGIGEDDPNADNKSREGRKQARRVEVRVFSLDLGGDVNAGTASPGATNTSLNNNNATAAQSTASSGQQR
jgi:outer membrane protein OmpA-like peptidoglycan-associated protein